ncbi:bestrophin-like domain [Achromobacter denitrificans]
MIPDRLRETNVLREIDETYIFFICIIVFLAIIEICFRLGRKQRRASDETAKTHIGALQTALLGLLALLLGFTFAMSVTRFETRKNLVLEEANAIGNAYWRSQLLPPAARDPIAALLLEYTTTALDFHDADNDDARLATAGATSRRIERQIRSTAASVLESPPSISAIMFIQAINEMAQVNEKRRVALENHVPEPVFYLLFIVTSGAMAFIAYGTGLQKRRRLISTGLFATLISLVLTFILDIDQPASGVIKVSQESMLRMKATLEQER